MTVDPWASPTPLAPGNSYQVETADELEALRAAGHAVIVNDEGVEWRRDRHGLEWVRLGQNERLVRASSQQLAVNGPWTVVWAAA